MKAIFLRLCSKTGIEVRATRLLTKAISKLVKHANSVELVDIHNILMELSDMVGNLIPTNTTMKEDCK